MSTACNLIHLLDPNGFHYPTSRNSSQKTDSEVEEQSPDQNKKFIHYWYSLKIVPSFIPSLGREDLIYYPYLFNSYAKHSSVSAIKFQVDASPYGIRFDTTTPYSVYFSPLSVLSVFGGVFVSIQLIYLLISWIFTRCGFRKSYQQVASDNNQENISTI